MILLEQYIVSLKGHPNYPGLYDFHVKHIEQINLAKGSDRKHQAWTGGYRDHIEQCLDIASELYQRYKANFKFGLDSVFMVLYFHDIEKIWKDKPWFDKLEFYTVTLDNVFKIKFTQEELKALQYIHGEPDDEYILVADSPNRLMNELGALCHAADVLSARAFHTKTKI